MIIATNAGNPELFFEGGVSEVVYDFFAGGYRPSDTPLPKGPALLRTSSNPPSSSALYSFGRQGWKKKNVRDFMTAAPAPVQTGDPYAFARDYLGKEFFTEVKSIGTAPLLLQVIHNNYCEGITSLCLTREQGILVLSLQDGDVRHRLPIRLDHSTGTVLNLNGEPYLVGIKARVTTDPEERTVLFLRLCFLEEALERELSVIFHRKDCLILKWDETPGTTLVLNALTNTLNEPGSFSLLMTGVLSQISPELLTNTVRGALTPETRARTNEKGSEDDRTGIQRA